MLQTFRASFGRSSRRIQFALGGAVCCHPHLYHHKHRLTLILHDQVVALHHKQQSFDVILMFVYNIRACKLLFALLTIHFTFLVFASGNGLYVLNKSWLSNSIKLQFNALKYLRRKRALSTTAAKLPHPEHEGRSSRRFNYYCLYNGRLLMYRTLCVQQVTNFNIYS